MSNASPYWDRDGQSMSDQTQIFPAAGSQHPDLYDAADYQLVPSSLAQGASPRGVDREPSLLAGKFDMKQTGVNLTILAVLCAVVTFAVVLIVDQVVAAVSDTVARPVGDTVLAAVLTCVVGVLVGLLYIPVVDTANEGLFGAAIVALTVAGVVVWVLFGGLLDGDWSTLTTLAAVLCTGVTAASVPSRIDAARVQ
jgi:hypothetical protein